MLLVGRTQILSYIWYSSSPTCSSLSSFPGVLVPDGAVLPLTLLRALVGCLVFLKHSN